MIVVSDSGPLMALGKLGLLELLSRLYGQVRVPTGVFEEVVGKGRERGFSDASAVRIAVQRRQLVVVAVSDSQLPADIAALPLDMGEKQTLFLALRDKVSLVLVDDSKARDAVRSRGLAVKGTLGVIVQAYRSGLLELGEVQAIVEAVIARDDIWIADELCRQVLANLKGSAPRNTGRL